MDQLIFALDQIASDIHVAEEAIDRLRKTLHSGGTNIMQDTCRAVTIMERQVAVLRDSFNAIQAADAGLPYAREYRPDSTGQATWAPTPAPGRGIA